MPATLPRPRTASRLTFAWERTPPWSGYEFDVTVTDRRTGTTPYMVEVVGGGVYHFAKHPTYQGGREEEVYETKVTPDEWACKCIGSQARFQAIKCRHVRAVEAMRAAGVL